MNRQRLTIILLSISLILITTAAAITFVQQSNKTDIIWSFNNGHDISLTFETASGNQTIVTFQLSAFATRSLCCLSLAIWEINVPSGAVLLVNGTMISSTPTEIGLITMTANQRIIITGIVTFTPPTQIGYYDLGVEIDQGQ